jgi:hypothetical protein
MYEFVLAAHSLNRWLVLGLLVAAAVTASRGATRAVVLVTDLQLLLGLVLYAVLSPYTEAVFADFGAAMADRTLRFWTVEHGPTMLVAVILVHVGNVLTRRAPTPSSRRRRAAIWFGLALLLVLASIPWPFLEYGRGLLPRL